VQILSEDGSFGIRLTPALAQRFFIFEVVVGDEVLGDGEPAIEWSSVEALSSLRRAEDNRLDPDRNSASAILDLLISEDEPELYDQTLISFGEGMDGFVTRAYLWADEAVFLFRPAEAAVGGSTKMARISTGELSALAAAALAAHTAFDEAR